MATQAAMFSFLTIQILVLVTSAKGDPQIQVQPSEITRGLSSSLNINCSFSFMDHPEMAAFVSLILSRANSSGGTFEVLATVTEFAPNSVALSTQEKVSATGVHSQTGESFLHLAWEDPTATQAGVYQCIARGLSTLGQTVEAVNTSIVTVVEPNLSDLVEKLKQMDSAMVSMNDHIQALEFNNSQMRSYMTDLEKTATQLRPFLRFNLLGTYQNHDYFVSKEGFSEINHDMDLCKYYGGYLVEIDTKDELDAIKGFLGTTSAFHFVIVAGTDEESQGTWVYQSNNQSSPYTSWVPSGVPTRYSRNCLVLLRTYRWDMNDFECHRNPPEDDIRFACEMPHV